MNINSFNHWFFEQSMLIGNQVKKKRENGVIVWYTIDSEGVEYYEE